MPGLAARQYLQYIMSTYCETMMRDKMKGRSGVNSYLANRIFENENPQLLERGG